MMNRENTQLMPAAEEMHQTACSPKAVVHTLSLWCHGALYMLPYTYKLFWSVFNPWPASI